MQAARTHLGDKRRRYENKKPEYSKLYHTQRWIKQSNLFREKNPLCVACLQYGIITDCQGKDKNGRPKGATDHIVPHKGNKRLFFDKTNWQTLCLMHHNQKSAKERNDY